MRKRTIVILSLLAIGLGGCALFGPACPGCNSHTRSSSSLVAFLYPDGAAPPADSIPELQVPLRVGLAFLPSQSAYGAEGPTAVQKDELLERIRQHFADRKFVREIVVIPDYYLSTAKGFAGLQGVQRLYNVDLMALASYDQVTFSNEMKYRSLAYLTIVGAFVVQGTEHEVTTLVDLAVVDPKTRSLVLRAGGADSRHGTSTLVDKAKETRATGTGSFAAATDGMIEHFDAALTKFEADVHAGTAQVRVVNRDGSARGGGGALGEFELLLLALLALVRIRFAPHSRRPGRQR